MHMTLFSSKICYHWALKIIMKEKQLIYITLDLRRALWLTEAVGAKIVCAYTSDLIKPMREMGADIWCFEEEYPEAEIPRSTFMLLSRALTLNMLRDLSKELQKELQFIVFKPSNKLKNWAEKEGWSLLSSSIETCRQLEDKVTFSEFAEKHTLDVPKHRVLLWDEAELEDYQAEFGDKFIVQGRMGHAGNCTYVVESGKELPKLAHGSRVKVSQWVEGKTYTVNAVFNEGELRFGPIWRQIMHVSEWNSYEMGTVGVSPADEELTDQAKQSLGKTIDQLKPLLEEVKYSGFFGIDLILDEAGKWWIIEMNPRLTATVSLQCFLDVTSERTPLLGNIKQPLASSLKPQASRLKLPANYGQIILRNSLKRAWQLPKGLKSGIYRHEKGDWKLVNRSADARELQDGDILLLLSRKVGTKIDPGSDYASLQFAGSAYNDADELDDRFFDFYERVVQGRAIRETELWQDRYAKLVAYPYDSIFMLRKPVGDPRERDQDIPAKLRQTELHLNESLQLLGELDLVYLVQKVDGTRGWLPKLAELEEQADDNGHEIPGKLSKTAEEFFNHWLGKPYLLGGNSEQGIDCSAFVQRYFWETKGILLPKYSQDQRAACEQTLELAELEDDDLLFMHSKDKPYDHVGVCKAGKIWHSSLETGVVCQNLEELKERYVLEEGRRVRV
jgi:predicted ATP-grasp superfamily ATP-dependent carboligase